MKRKGCHRDLGLEGSVEQTREPMNKNWIEACRASGPLTAKPQEICRMSWHRDQGWSDPL